MIINVSEVGKQFQSKTGKTYWKLKLTDGTEGAANFEPRVGENQADTWDKTPGIYYAPRDRKYTAQPRKSLPSVDRLDQGYEMMEMLKKCLEKLDILLEKNRKPIVDDEDPFKGINYP